MIIYKALLKYGYENFRVLILEYCNVDNQVLLEREQYFIDTLKPQYNILSKSGSSYGYRHTEETKEKFRNREFTAETRLKISKASEGRITDATTRMKISIFFCSCPLSRTIYKGKEFDPVFLIF
jgi:group I intron endonuclease